MKRFYKQGKTVLDSKTGLLWQQGGSKNPMIYADAADHIARLNREKFAGFNDWRLPTRDEAMALLDRQPVEDGFFIDPVFDRVQRWIWTSDKRSASTAWFVYFLGGLCHYIDIGDLNYVRAVRSGQS